MLSILNNHSLGVIKKKFIAIYLLNVTDIIFTIILLKTGLFIEANTIMRLIIGNQVVSIAVKIIVPLIVILIVLLRIGDATDKQLFLANKIINACLIIYIFINFSHCLWSLSYFIYNFIY